MSIRSLNGLGSIDPRSVYGQNSNQPATGFAEQLKQAVREVDNLQTSRDETIENMVKGEITEVHDVMTAAEEAQLAFELLLEVRNKLLESYQEIMRMQV